MFKLRQVADGVSNGLLGYEWIKVLQVYPSALKENDGTWGPFAEKLIHCSALVETENGLQTVTWDDVLEDIEAGWLVLDEREV